jgi:hypothetical protein
MKAMIALLMPLSQLLVVQADETELRGVMTLCGELVTLRLYVMSTACGDAGGVGSVRGGSQGARRAI